MNPSKLFTLSMILIFCNSLIPASCQSLYVIVCKDTLRENRAPCIRLMQGDPKFFSAKNYVDLANNILDLAITKGTQCQSYMSNDLKGNPSPAIKKCATTLYNESLSSFQKARINLVKDPVTATYAARVAGDGPEHCAEAIKEAKINDPIIVYVNTKLLLLSDIASIAARKLVKVMK